MSARDARLLTVITQALRRARGTGSLVTGRNHQEEAEIAHTALRHIQGCEKRGVSLRDFEHRGVRTPGRDQEKIVGDLADGLLAKVGKDVERGAQLTADSRKLAEALLRAFVAVPPDPPPVPVDSAHSGATPSAATPSAPASSDAAPADTTPKSDPPAA